MRAACALTISRRSRPSRSGGQSGGILRYAALLVAAGLATAVPALAQEERRIGLEEQTGVAVTIYNDNLAMIRDQRRIELTRGANRLAFVEVSGRMRAETALLSGGEGAAFRLLEQNFNFDLLTPQSLLEKSVGGTVRIVRTDPKTQEEIVETATVLSAASGVVLQIGDRIYTGVPGRMIFDGIPANMRARPTLVLDLESDTAGPVPVELTYLTQGLSWQADYVALLNDAETEFDLNGWVTLNNQSGTTYRDARLQLVAGDVHQVTAPARDRHATLRREAAPVAEMPRREGLADYHLYTIDRPTTIADNQQKQVALMRAAGVKADKQYHFTGSAHYYRAHVRSGAPVKADVWMVFDNAKGSNLGVPLPRGIVRVYKKDSSGQAVFVGEDRIDHTAEDQTVRLRLGKAFDVAGTRVQTAYRRISADARVHESAYRVTLTNAKDTPVTVLVREPIPGDWEMLAESRPHTKLNAYMVEWAVEVPAKGKTELTYRVRVTQ